MTVNPLGNHVAKFVKIKRSIREGPLSALIHAEGPNIFYYKLASEEQNITRSIIPIQEVLNELEISPAKRRKVKVIVRRPSIDKLDFIISDNNNNKDDEDHENDDASGYEYDFYVLKKMQPSDNVLLDDPTKVGIISNYQDLEYADYSESDPEDEREGATDDSNAEDYYRNDYPDEGENENGNDSDDSDEYDYTSTDNNNNDSEDDSDEHLNGKREEWIEYCNSDVDSSTCANLFAKINLKDSDASDYNDLTCDSSAYDCSKGETEEEEEEV